jgi:hypothetical protein
VLGPPFLAGAPFLIDGMRFILRGHHPQLGWLLDDRDASTLGLSEAEIRGLRALSRLHLPGDGAGWLTPDPLLSHEQRLARVADLPGWHLHGGDRDYLASRDRPSHLIGRKTAKLRNGLETLCAVDCCHCWPDCLASSRERQCRWQAFWTWTERWPRAGASVSRT